MKLLQIFAKSNSYALPWSRKTERKKNQGLPGFTYKLPFKSRVIQYCGQNEDLFYRLIEKYIYIIYCINSY